MRDLSGTELLIVALILVFLFGSKKIPEFVRGLREAIEEYRDAVKK
jgi:sec-independent protein translocase protein TatA